ncbi:MAG: DUF4102 domain-containing protein [Gammaproteobacteria bacterium]|nr:DUF4102 domain-containing protein [Gammaproteobacteria bacterium]MYG67923.1 DUF4102 domain-containing protein [Gammaproteobacteria bacterium]
MFYVGQMLDILLHYFSRWRTILGTLTLDRIRAMKLLKASQLAGLKKPGMHRVADSLYLRIAPGGSKQFVQRLMVHGKRKDIGLGGYPATSLSEAKDKAVQNRAAVLDGNDPVADRRAIRKALVRKANVPTFRKIADEVYNLKCETWKSASPRHMWQTYIPRYVLPVIGDIPVDRIDRTHTLEILLPLWAAKPSIGRNVRQNLKAVFEYAMSHGHIDHNPAGEVINGALPSQKAKTQHFDAIPWKDVPAAIEGVRNTESPDTVRAALEFIILTAARQAEALGATWAEIDGDTWVIPASRMKTGKEHRVPLSPAAMSILESMKPYGDETGIIFPGVRNGGRIANNMIRKARIAAGVGGTVHGFRSSFRDWCAETGKPRELAEAALAHIVGGVEGAYFRSDLFDRRRVLMEQWAAHCTGQTAKVVRLSA